MRRILICVLVLSLILSPVSTSQAGLGHFAKNSFMLMVAVCALTALEHARHGHEQEYTGNKETAESNEQIEKSSSYCIDSNFVASFVGAETAKGAMTWPLRMVDKGLRGTPLGSFVKGMISAGAHQFVLLAGWEAGSQFLDEIRQGFKDESDRKLAQDFALMMNRMARGTPEEQAQAERVAATLLDNLGRAVTTREWFGRWAYDTWRFHYATPNLLTMLLAMVGTSALILNPLGITGGLALVISMGAASLAAYAVPSSWKNKEDKALKTIRISGAEGQIQDADKELVDLDQEFGLTAPTNETLQRSMESMKQNLARQAGYRMDLATAYFEFIYNSMVSRDILRQLQGQILSEMQDEDPSFEFTAAAIASKKSEYQDRADRHALLFDIQERYIKRRGLDQSRIIAQLSPLRAQNRREFYAAKLHRTAKLEDAAAALPAIEQDIASWSEALLYFYQLQYQKMSDYADQLAAITSKDASDILSGKASADDPGQVHRQRHAAEYAMFNTEARKLERQVAKLGELLTPDPEDDKYCMLTRFYQIYIKAYDEKNIDVYLDKKACRDENN